MKKISPTFILLLAFFSSFAQQVDLHTAQSIANRFYSAKGTGSLKPDSVIIIQNDKSTPLIYVFTDRGSRSFMALSANKSAYPLLAWSFESGFMTKKNEGMKDYFRLAALQIEETQKLDLVSDATIDNAWSNMEKSGTPRGDNSKNLSPLLSTTWDQGCYYNGMAPAHTSGPCGRCYAGCVATAMAQVMKYHNYPPSGIGSHSYGTMGYGLLSANFANTTYHWDSMPNAINDSNFHIAQLLFHCGVSVEMSYAPDGSGAFTADAREAYVNYFNYAPYATYSERGAVGDTEWGQILMYELDCSRPILYHGYGTDGGHAFVCDGYDGPTHFHFNWGWSGYGNGYYYVNNLNPGGSGFSDGQGIVFMIEPPTGDSQHCASSVTLTAAKDTITDGSDSLRYGNNSNCKWIIAPPNTGLIKIKFLELAVEEGMDNIYIIKGDQPTQPIIATVTGHNIPSEILVYNDKAMIWFASNENSRDLGFKIAYETVTAGIEEALNAGALNIYPNPCSDFVRIEANTSIEGLIEKIEILDASGKILVSQLASDKNEIDLRGVSQSALFIRLSGQGESVVKALIRQ